MVLLVQVMCSKIMDLIKDHSWNEGTEHICATSETDLMVEWPMIAVSMDVIRETGSDRWMICPSKRAYCPPYASLSDTFMHLAPTLLLTTRYPHLRCPRLYHTQMHVIHPAQSRKFPKPLGHRCIR